MNLKCAARAAASSQENSFYTTERGLPPPMCQVLSCRRPSTPCPVLSLLPGSLESNGVWFAFFKSKPYSYSVLSLNDLNKQTKTSQIYSL